MSVKKDYITGTLMQPIEVRPIRTRIEEENMFMWIHLNIFRFSNLKIQHKKWNRVNAKKLSVTHNGIWRQSIWVKKKVNENQEWKGNVQKEGWGAKKVKISKSNESILVRWRVSSSFLFDSSFLCSIQQYSTLYCFLPKLIDFNAWRVE